ncbi:MAG: DUF167 domain-containing protein [Promethearchaeota archaeon]
MEKNIFDARNLPYIRVKGNNIFLDLHVKPNSKEDYILFNNTEFTVFTTAPPIKGNANKQIQEDLSKLFNVKKSNIEIVAGVKSHSKKLRITCENAEHTNNVLKILISKQNQKI